METNPPLAVAFSSNLYWISRGTCCVFSSPVIDTI
jgi:hypothetical protein